MFCKQCQCLDAGNESFSNRISHHAVVIEFWNLTKPRFCTAFASSFTLFSRRAILYMYIQCIFLFSKLEDKEERHKYQGRYRRRNIIVNFFMFYIIADLLYKNDNYDMRGAVWYRLGSCFRLLWWFRFISLEDFINNLSYSIMVFIHTLEI